MQYLAIHNLLENLKCLTALGDMSGDVEYTALLDGVVSVASSPQSAEADSGAFPPTPSEGGGALMEQG